MKNNQSSIDACLACVVECEKCYVMCLEKGKM